MALIQSSWNLSQSAKDVVGVSIAALEAATTDNVQSLALLAAEAFGATLQMSPESKSQVFRLCSKDQQSAITTFFQASIGYRRGDSGWFLCRSDAGCRFLGLAACLLSIKHWEAGEVLRELIAETSEDKRLIPTSQHLKELLHALRDRLVHAGFVQSVIGWNELLANHDNLGKFEVGKDSWQIPRSAILSKLIKGMSQVARIGESNPNSYIEVQVTYTEAAWTMAFVKWCLGSPPTVVLSKDHTPVFEQQGSKVLLVLYDLRQPGSAFNQVHVMHSIDDVSELISGLDKTSENLISGTMKGMVAIDSFCQAWRRRNFDGVEDSTCQQVLPFACYLAMTRLDWINSATGVSVVSYSIKSRLINHLSIDAPMDFDQTATHTVKDARIRLSQILPDSHTISNAMKRFLGVKTDNPMVLRKPPSSRLRDLPPLRSLLKIPAPQCPCINCKPSTRNPTAACKRDYEFFNKMTEATAIVILLSMLEPFAEEEILIPWDGKVERNFYTAVYSCLADATGRCGISDMTTVLFTFMGHKPPKQDQNSRVMSSGNGQTIYPMILENSNILSRGLLTFRCLPGSIFWNQQKYDYVVQGRSDFVEETGGEDVDTISSGYSRDPNTGVEMRLLEPSPITRVENSYPNFEIEWLVTAHSYGLMLTLSTPSIPGKPDRRPLNIITTAATSIYVDCPHNRTRPMVEPSTTLFRGSIMKPFENLREDWETAIVMIGDNSPARLYMLSGYEPGLVRGEACLQCCIDAEDLCGTGLIIC